MKEYRTVADSPAGLLTVREEFAARNMAALLARSQGETIDRMASQAVLAADALIGRLNAELTPPASARLPYDPQL